MKGSCISLPRLSKGLHGGIFKSFSLSKIVLSFLDINLYVGFIYRCLLQELNKNLRVASIYVARVCQ